MPYYRLLVHTAPWAVAGLVIGCLVIGTWHGLLQLADKHWVAAWSVGAGQTMLSVLFGSVVVLVYGWPLYTLLYKVGMARYWIVVIAGLFPGGVLYSTQYPREWGEMVMLYGAVIALATHIVAMRFSERVQTKG